MSNIEFAIYKCGRGHTWNKMLGILKPTDKICKFAAKRVNLECHIDKISIDELKAANVKEIEIYIKGLDSKMRLDKILPQQIIDLSRGQIEKLISCSKILINNQRVKQLQGEHIKLIIIPGFLFYKINNLNESIIHVNHSCQTLNHRCIIYLKYILIYTQ